MLILNLALRMSIDNISQSFTYLNALFFFVCENASTGTRTSILSNLIYLVIKNVFFFLKLFFTH